jgi:hypothetical protein
VELVSNGGHVGYTTIVFISYFRQQFIQSVWNLLSQFVN